MDGALDLAAVNRVAVAGLEVGGAAQLDDVALLVLDNLVALDDVGAHQADLAVRFHAEELRRRYLGKVVRVDVELAGERNLSDAGLLILRDVGQLEILFLVLRVVGDDHLDRVQDGDAALGGGVELITDAVLQQADVDDAVGLGDAGLLDKLVDGARGVAAAAQAADGGHSRVVPAVHLFGLDQLAQVALAHDGVGDVQAGKLVLVGLVLKADVVHNPVVQRAVVFKLDRAQRVGDALQRVLDGMGEVVQRVDAPLVALAVMVRMHDAVDGRVAHVHVRGGHVDLGAQGVAAVRELAVLHPLKQVEVFLHRAVSPRAFLARLGQGAAVLAHLVGGQVVDIGFAVLNQLDGVLVALVEVVRTVVDAAGRLGAQPAQVLLDRFDVLVVLTDRVGVVKAQVEQAVVFLRGAGVDPDCLGRADVQVAVRLRREAGVHLGDPALGQVAVDDVVDKVRHVFGVHDFFISHFVFSPSK